MTALEFAGEHPWVTLFIVWLLFCLIESIFKIIFIGKCCCKGGKDDE